MEPVQDDQAEKKKTDIILNTSGACFLCLQDYHGGPDPVKNLSGGTIDLTNICHHLNINQCSLLLTSLNKEPAGVEDLNQDLCTFSVNLCPKCLELTQKLNDMIVQLEKVKLMVNFQLHSFHKILEGNLEWVNLQDRMNPHSDNSLEAKLGQLLREEVQDKSFKILKKAEVAKPQPIPPKCYPPTPPPQEPPSVPIPSMKTLLTQLVTSTAIPSKKPIKSKLHRCPFCTKIIGNSKISQHLSCLHPSKLLISFFPPSSTQPSPSEDICRHVLSSQGVTQAAKLQSSTSPRLRLACHLCGITYGHGNLLKQHFLIAHTEQLIAEILKFEKNNPSRQKIQNMPPLIPAPKKPRPSSPSNSVDHLIQNLIQTSLINPSENDKDDDTGSKKYQCPFCQDSMATPKFLRRHLANIHPDKLLAPFTPSILDKLKDNPTKFTQLCGKVLASHLSLAVKLQVTTFTEKGPSPASSSVSSKLGCHLCAREYSDRRTLKHHFLVDHTDNLVEQLIKMQNLKIGLKDKQKKKKEKKVIEKVKPLKVKRLRRAWDEPKTCAICVQTLSDSTKLRRHQVTKHPDQLFLGVKPSWMDGEKFGGICKEVFKGEVEGANCGELGRGKGYKCGYCPPGGGKSFKGYVDFTVHLCYQHREEMEGKLKDKLEEDAGEFDVKPDIEELGDLLYPDVVLDEVISKEVKLEEEENDNLDYL